MKALCPICQKAVEKEGNQYRPFCSERCKLIDLGHWAQGTYRVPTDEQRNAIEDSEGTSQDGE